jgi:hypothetical protein
VARTIWITRPICTGVEDAGGSAEFIVGYPGPEGTRHER